MKTGFHRNERTRMAYLDSRARPPGTSAAGAYANPYFASLFELPHALIQVDRGAWIHPATLVPSRHTEGETCGSRDASGPQVRSTKNCSHAIYVRPFEQEEVVQRLAIWLLI
jgi:hypothetical protein